jgi:hypothetical protein
MKSKILLVALLVGVIASGSGCLLFVAGAAAGAGVGTYAYVSGELKATEGVTLDKAWDATLAAMTDLKYSVTEKQKTGLEGNLTARAPGDRKVQIHLEKKSDTVTQLGIRVGTFGDESLSRQILAKIKSHF